MSPQTPPRNPLPTPIRRPLHPPFRPLQTEIRPHEAQSPPYEPGSNQSFILLSTTCTTSIPPREHHHRFMSESGSIQSMMSLCHDHDAPPSRSQATSPPPHWVDGFPSPASSPSPSPSTVHDGRPVIHAQRPNRLRIHRQHNLPAPECSRVHQTHPLHSSRHSLQ